MDSVFANRRFIALFAALDVPGRPDLVDAVAAMAALGPQTRLTLSPQATRRIWVTGNSKPVVHQMPESMALMDSAAILQLIRRQSGHRYPLEIHASQRVIVLDVDHGLGDGRFVLDLVSALFAYAQGRTTSWGTHRDTPLALPRAFFRKFALRPSQFRVALQHLVRGRSATTQASSAITPASLGWSPSPAVSVARVSAQAESAVDAWRSSNETTMGNAALWLYIVRRALAAAGLEMTENVVVAIDCRRYLPLGTAVKANFAFGLTIRVTADDSPNTISSRLRDVTAVGVPLAGMAAVSAYGLIRRRKDTRPVGYVGTPSADLMYSDLGRISALDDAPWSGDERFIAGLLDPGGSNGVSVLNTCLGATRTISISFHDNVIDRRIIDDAADRLKEPIELLPP